MTTSHADFQHINDTDRFLVCCFYTQSYLDHAKALKQTLDDFKISYYFKEVKDAGYWEANTRIKPHFILECLQEFPNKSILYLDADARVKKPLDYFNHITADVAFYNTKGMPEMSHDYLASTLFFNNTEATKQLVEQWIREQEHGKRTQVDQDSLDAAMQKLESALTVAPLSAGYIKIFDKDYQGDIYIEQYQASRSQTKLRRKLIRRRNKVFAIVFILLLLTATLSIIIK